VRFLEYVDNYYKIKQSFWLGLEPSDEIGLWVIAKNRKSRSQKSQAVTLCSTCNNNNNNKAFNINFYN